MKEDKYKIRWVFTRWYLYAISLTFTYISQKGIFYFIGNLIVTAFFIIAIKQMMDNKK